MRDKQLNSPVAPVPEDASDVESIVQRALAILEEESAAFVESRRLQAEAARATGEVGTRKPEPVSAVLPAQEVPDANVPSTVFFRRR